MDKKLVILQVHNFYQLPGGEDTVIENERLLLESQGHRVVRYFRDNKELKDFSVFRKLLLPVTTIFNPKTYREVRRLIRAEHIDIVHVHNTLNLISPSVYYAALAEGVPVVQTVHNFRLLCPGATFYRDGHICEDCLTHGLGCAVKHSCYRGSKLQTLACVISTKIHRMTGIYGKLNYICLTEFNREKLLKLKQIRPERVFVKPNFVEKSGNDPRFDGRKTQLLYVGRLEKIKGTDLLLKAWLEQREVDEVQLRLPDWEQPLLRHLATWAEELSLQQAVNARILHYAPVIEALLRLKASYTRLQDGTWAFEAEGQRVTIRVHQGEVTVTPDAAHPVSLTGLEANRLLLYPFPWEGMPETVPGWFPLPLSRLFAERV